MSRLSAEQARAAKERETEEAGLERKPFEPDGAYYKRAMWHWRAEAERLAAELAKR